MTAGQVGKHSAPRIGWSRTKIAAVGGSAVVLVGVVGGVIAFAVTRGPTPAQKRAHAAAVAQAHAAAVAAEVRSAQGALLAALKITPTSGATGVALNGPVTVTAGSGALSAVKVVSASGVALAGSVSPTTGAWVSTGSLLPTTTYTITASVVGDGVTADQTSKFTTLTPVTTVEASAYPTEGMTVGVGQPIVLTFDHDVTSATAQQAIISRLTVAMSTPVAGGWYWFSDHELHFRPETLWPADETVRVAGDLGGIGLGNGEWTAGSVLDTFNIGDRRVSYANLETEEMTVTLNGRTVYSFPISGGRPQYPTMNGIHIVLDRQSVVHMVSSTVGIPVNSPNGYDEYVYDDVHISDSGEYVHAAPWSVSDQGVTNVSHGCINLSTSNAETFFGFSRVGDVVEVTGSSRAPVWGDHGVMDWSGPAWSQWTAAAVVALNSPATTTTSSTSSTSTTVAAATVTGAPASTGTSTATSTGPSTTARPEPATTVTTKPAVTTTKPTTTTTTKG